VKKTPTELKWAKIRKAATSAIRLKYSLMADEEINEVLARLELEYTKAVNNNKPYELDTATLMRDLDADQG
jgi:hypothetical protein